MSNMKKNAFDDSEHLARCGERWKGRMNRKPTVLGFREEWLSEQCLHCEYYMPLSGPMAEDWGMCSNPLSPFDGTVRFEHDGCDYFSEAIFEDRS